MPHQGGTLVLTVLLAAASPAADSDWHSDPQADALGVQLMDAVGAKPANCPPEALFPYSVVLCGRPSRQFRQDRDALRQAVDDVIGSRAASEWKPAARGDQRYFMLHDNLLVAGITPKGYVYLRYFWQFERCLPEVVDTPLLVGEGAKTVDPVVIPETKKPPVYPDLARRAMLEGDVVVQARISEQGRVESACVTYSSRPNVGFEEAALEAVNGWRWTPATVGGRPVPFTMMLIVGSSWSERPRSGRVILIPRSPRRTEFLGSVGPNNRLDKLSGGTT